jgi:hypothetical protein
MVRDEEPLVADADKNIRGLDYRFVKTVGKGRGDMFRAGDPANIAFHAYPNRTESDANALCVGKYSSPAAAHLVPAEQEFAAGLDALNVVVMRPRSFHLRHVEGLERGVEALVRSANAFFGRLFWGCGWRRHRLENGKSATNSLRLCLTCQSALRAFLRQFHTADGGEDQRDFDNFAGNERKYSGVDCARPAETNAEGEPCAAAGENDCFAES